MKHNNNAIERHRRISSKDIRSQEGSKILIWRSIYRVEKD
jgi:hypothetical protein